MLLNGVPATLEVGCGIGLNECRCHLWLWAVVVPFWEGDLE